jgi:hypothetical protein
VGDERGGRRFSIGARDCDQRALSTRFGALAAKQLDVADDLHICLAGKGHSPMWLRVGQWHAGGQHQGGNARPVDRVKVLCLQPCCLRVGNLLLVIVESDNVGTAFFHRSRGEQTRTAEAKNRDPLPGERGDRNQGSSQLERR